ncbi:MAG: hypothetical protein H6828_02970 [Planctomycetes bacterium]|nr:hypothetical protein [Planctomycetota bacterium]
MNSFIKGTSMSLAALALVSSANAAEIIVNSNITTSTTWTANNTYNLQQQIYVMPGATLTIEAGTVIASDTGVGGSLAVANGAQINVLGTQRNPVIMTSKADVATWTGGDPTTGTWREGVNEWGNLTIMGDGYISEDATVGNTPSPSASNVAAMEGLVADFPGDTKVLYGGGNDNDDSGTISFLSLRYGGKVIGLNNELNGLSLGGVGNGTDIAYVDIMNNVDDGCEIWGGCVNLKYFNIWNIGDDSFDIDQGYRGKVQFVLIVQGYSADAAQGSGVGDNCFETDGAEDSDWQPVTTTCIYNATVIGQPADGDGATTWRDNARIQYRNCIFMDCGEKVVRFDNVDGDGAQGYGFNGTLSWAQTWTTDWNAVPAHANDPAPGILNYCTSPQVDGKLAEITDSVFFRNLSSDAYTEANNVGVFNAGNNNVLIPGFADIDSPITALTRFAPVTKGGKTMVQVSGIDPRPANAALTSVGTAPADGFFTPAAYRGAFAPTVQPWIAGWTASDAFGFVMNPTVGKSYCYGDGATSTPCPCGNDGAIGTGCANSNGYGAKLVTSGSASVGSDDLVLNAEGLQPNQPGLYFQGQNATNNGLGLVFGDGLRCAGGNVLRLGVRISNAQGTSSTSGISIVTKGSVSAGLTRRYQIWFRNPGVSSCGNFFSLSNGIEVDWQL